MKNEDKKDFKSYANSFQAVTVPGLSRVRALCDALGNPERFMKFIHIDGTNGKGSTSECMACILEDAGYTVGKFISPNLIKVNERISVGGEDISDAELKEILDTIEPHSKEVERITGLYPTQFEIWTAAALLYFKRKKCDYVVLEVGLGGELDATNIIPENEIAIITRLGLDHTQYLGNTIGEVACAKAGILKPTGGTRALITPRQDKDAMSVIEKRASELGISIIVPEYIHTGKNGIFERFSIDGIGEIECGISGLHQIENASLAAEAARALGIAPEHIISGIGRSRNPARFELIEKDPDVIYDGGHNENGIEALVRSLDRYYGSVPKTVIFACMSDKKIDDSLRMLSEGKTEFIFTTVKDNPRAGSAKSLWERAAAIGYEGVAEEDIGRAYELARSKGNLTLICGSLYLYRDLREYLDRR